MISTLGFNSKCRFWVNYNFKAKKFRESNDSSCIKNHGCNLLYSLLSSSRSPFNAPLLLCTGLGSGTLLTSFEAIGDGFMSVNEVSSLSNSSFTSSE